MVLLLVLVLLSLCSAGGVQTPARGSAALGRDTQAEAPRPEEQRGDSQRSDPQTGRSGKP